MDNRSIAITIRSKKLGVLIRGARQASEKSVAECSKVIGVPPTTFEAYERGEISPSLPELEALAFYLKVPLELFWGRELAFPREQSENQLEIERLLGIRQRIVGTLLRQSRLASGISPEEVADRAGISEQMLSEYELGEKPIPVPELESLANILNRPIRDFQDHRGRIGTWHKQQAALRNLSELSPELQDFISKPVNRPYLELAQRLSEMSVEKLRGVAEGLLEITL
jgi:transcriptional regulator with XRE-family HTH domain